MTLIGEALPLLLSSRSLSTTASEISRQVEIAHFVLDLLSDPVSKDPANHHCTITDRAASVLQR